MISVVQLLASFNESALTIEQAERLAAIRQACAGLAAVVHQGLPDSVWRDRALDSLRDTFLAAREALAIEAAPSGNDPMKERRELLALASEALTRRQNAALAALLGVAPDEGKGKGKRANGTAQA